MREIKFRGWDEKTKKMVYWSLNDLLVRFNADEKYKGDDKPSPFFEWMESTGLRDKNETVIYEGDIVKHSYRVSVTVVEWREKEAQWSMGGYNNDTVEVVGNVYENPELLKEEAE